MYYGEYLSNNTLNIMNSYVSVQVYADTTECSESGIGTDPSGGSGASLACYCYDAFASYWTADISYSFASEGVAFDCYGSGIAIYGASTTGGSDG